MSDPINFSEKIAAGPFGVFEVTVCARRKCRYRCYYPDTERDNCYRRPCKCKLDHGVEILEYFARDASKPMGAAPLRREVAPGPCA